LRGFADTAAQVKHLPSARAAGSHPPSNLGKRMLYAVFWLAGEIIHLYILAIIAAVVISLLINFGVINARSQFVSMVADFLERVTEPLLRPLRNALPNFGSIDISPLIAILLLEALQYVLGDIYNRLVFAGYGI
jgi:YggT family protein